MMSRLSKFWRRNEDGTVAIEFAIAIPVTMLIFFGVVAWFDAYRVAYRTGEAAAIVVDLASRTSQLNEQEVQELFTTAEALIGAAARRGEMSVQILSVVHFPNAGPDGAGCGGREMDGGGCLEVSWARSSTNAPTPELVELILPEIPRGESVVQAIVEVEYPYLFMVFEDTALDIDRTATRRPRFSDEVEFEG